MSTQLIERRVGSDDPSAIHILHIEDSAADLDIVYETLVDQGVRCRTTCVASTTAIRHALGHGLFDLIISDFSLPGFDGIEALDISRRLCPDTPFIFVSGTMGEESAVNCLRHGAVDYVLKHNLSRLGSAVQRAVNEARARRERKRAEEKIREQAALLDETQDSIYVTDLEFTVLYWNRGSERLYGWLAGEACGRGAFDLGAGPGIEGSVDATESVLANGHWSGEINRISKDGTKLVVQSRWSLVRDDKGRPKSILMIDTDVTERRRFEGQLLRTQRMQSIGALAGGIAHDLNNMLAPILMVADLIREDLRSEESKQMLDTAAGAARRGAEMVKQILAFARGVGGELHPLRVDRAVSELSSLVRDTFPRSIRLETVLPPDLPRIMADATQFQQVLLNLCLNSRDAMPGGGLLRIEASQFSCQSLATVPAGAGDFVIISVSDTGCGIRPEVLREVGKPFYTTKQNGKGTGLGFSTVLNIVKFHGGKVEIDSSVGLGTTVRVFMPVARDSVPTVAPLAATPSYAGQGELLLLVDDETAILEITKATLEAFNYRVLTASEGHEAMTILLEHWRDIAVVLTDLSMPSMGGIALARELRRL
ncbi:MAG TPA: response regulator, partial [Candidatus Limnocylindria bacterium]|nr:response regulator [Candidatus Limnocylindria bacterium]